MRFYVASSWMSPVCHRPHCPTTRQIMSILICTYPVRLMHAWHSNFTAQSQVCAASSGTGKPRFLYQMKKEKYSWIIEQIHDWQPGWWNSRRRKRKKEERTKIGIVKSIDAKDNFVWGLDLKNIAQKIKQAPKLIAGCPSEVKSHLYNFHSDSQYLFDSWAHRFCLCRSIGTNCVLKWIKRKSWLSIEHRNIPRMINILWSAHFSKICKYLSAIMRQGTFPA